MNGSRVSRRDLLRWSMLGGGTLPMALLAAACSSGRGGTAVSPGTAIPATTVRSPGTTTTTPTSAVPSTATAPTAAPTTTAFDPTKPWWLQANFAPVADEVEALDLAVSGALPPELDGLYVRNGSNPASGDSPHWFFGDGMAHGIRIAGGRAEWYRNRYVRTPMYTERLGFGQGPPGGAANQSNVSFTWHSGRILSSGEVGFPYVLDRSDLSTTGVFDFGGALTSSFTAHPKIDPRTGNLHFFGYGFMPPFLTYSVADPTGTIIHSEPVDLPASVMMHDFSITDQDVIFWDLPVHFDIDAAIAFIDDPASGAFPYAWRPEAGARLGVMPLGGPASAIRWYDIDPCFVFHGLNAFRSGDRIVIDVCRLDSMFAGSGGAFGGTQTLNRWTIDETAGTVADEVVEAERSGEFPTRDPRRVGVEHRFGYFADASDNGETVVLGGLIKRDYATGARTFWEPPPGVGGGEWWFVPAVDDSAEDAGWLMSFLHDARTGRSSFAVVDATDVAAGPVATVELPQRVPWGFHGTWVPTVEGGGSGASSTA